MEPLYHCRWVRLQLAVYPNRIEVSQERFGGAKRDAILLRSVVDVSIPGFGGKLRVTTTDGLIHEWVLGGHVEAARSAILAALPA